MEAKDRVFSESDFVFDRPSRREKSLTHPEHAAQPTEPGRCQGWVRTNRLAYVRHSYGAWLGDNGEPLTVQKELMRHASIQTTLNTYGGGMMESMREAHGQSREAGDGALMDASCTSAHRVSASASISYWRREWDSNPTTPNDFRKL